MKILENANELIGKTVGFATVFPFGTLLIGTVEGEVFAMAAEEVLSEKRIKEEILNHEQFQEGLNELDIIDKNEIQKYLRLKAKYE